MGDPDLTGKDVQAARTLVPDVSGFFVGASKVFVGADKCSIEMRFD